MLEELIAEALSSLSKERTETDLGDRSSYVGASDVSGCMRKAVLSKTKPAEHGLDALIRFERGHLAEEIIAKALKKIGRFQFQRQAEISPDWNVPFKAHLDFLFFSKDTLGILEVKSSSMPQTPYGSWEKQLHIQIGALKEKYPDRKIKGGILCIDLGEGDLKVWNGYVPNEAIFSGLKDKAETIWNCIEGQDEPTVDPGPLCGWCNYIHDCPAFQGEEVAGLEADVELYWRLKKQIKALEADFEAVKKRLLQLAKKKGPFLAGGTLFKATRRISKRTFWDKLKTQLETFGDALENYQEENEYFILDARPVSS